MWRSTMADATKSYMPCSRSCAMASRPKRSSEATISDYIYTSDLPDPDLIIRTSGEFRLSNFLIWQGAYSEIYTTETYWPEL